MLKKSQISDFIIPKIKYGATSLVATAVDYLVFFSVVYIASVEYATLAQVIAYSSGLLTNFFLQKTFVFELKRSVFQTFRLSVSFSLIGLGISTFLIFLLSKTAFFTEYLILAKILVTASMFLYNFYTKRFAFERRKLFDQKPDHSSK